MAQQPYGGQNEEAGGGNGQASAWREIHRP